MADIHLCSLECARRIVHEEINEDSTHIHIFSDGRGDGAGAGDSDGDGLVTVIATMMMGCAHAIHQEVFRQASSIDQQWLNRDSDHLHESDKTLLVNAKGRYL